jgi:cytochrome c
MDSFEFNKIAGAILGTLMLTMALGLFSGFIFSPNIPAKPGYELPDAPVEEAAPATNAPAVPLPVLLAKADVHKGEGFAKVCAACHNFQKGAGPKVGPPLWGVVGRPVASIANFDYSDAMKKKGGDWTLADVNTFITNPKAYVPGTKMGFAGEESPEKRADILSFLNSLSDSPKPLPAP